MRGKHTGSEKTGIKIVSQQVMHHRETHRKRNDKREKAKNKAFIFIGDKLV